MINSFLLIGQSNMAGRGSLGEVEPIENKDILMFRSNTWITAKEPLHTDKPELAGVGLGMSFAETLQKKYGKKIGLIPCAFGGTSLDEWKKDGALYSNAVSAALEAQKNSCLKGILWHQGENDADMLETAESYKDRFLTFIDPLFKDLGVSNMPVVLGELGEYLVSFGGCTYSHIVNAQLSQLARQEKYLELVSVKGLTDRGDFLHFNSESLREFGRRYAEAWELCSKNLGICLE
ncbi:MAG: sialate O-acetylesterase [Bacillota bacterium]|nr:sialate O-acetylesterase [Bacillota bacterium]